MARENKHNLLAMLVYIVLPMVVGASVAFAGADIENRIKTQEEQYEKTKQELEKNKKELEKKQKERKDVLKKLETMKKDIVTIDNSIITIQRRERNLNEKITVARTRHDEALNSLDRRSEEYAQRLRSMFKRQRMSPAGLLVASGSISTWLRCMHAYEIVAGNDVAVIGDIRKKSRTIESSIREISSALDAQQSLETKKRREKQTREKTVQQRQGLLEDIRRDEEMLKQAIIQHQKDMEKTQALIENLRKEAERTIVQKDYSAEIKNYNFTARKGKLPWPVRGKVIGKFGPVTDPKTKTTTLNRGIEIETNQGDPVSAIGSGVVVITRSFRGYGNFVVIKHFPNYYTIYAHLSDILVNTGAEVREGEIIGLTGSTGLINDSRAVLLLEILEGQEPSNPITWLQPLRRLGS